MRRISLIYPLILLFFTGLFVFQPQASAKQASPAVMQMNTVEGQRVVIPAEGQKTIVHFLDDLVPAMP